MKLTSMTDYILEHPATFDYEFLCSKHFDYAEFLKRPLELGMFVPCDENGKPYPSLEYCKGSLNDTMYSAIQWKNFIEIDYPKAQEKVLFKNVELIYADRTSASQEPMSESFSLRIDGKQISYWKSKPKYWIGFEDKTIEDLTTLNLELTGNHLNAKDETNV